MIAELKWIIPVIAAVAIATLTLLRTQSDSLPWSRAFIIAASLLIATTPIISQGKLSKDGLEFQTLSQGALTASAAMDKLAERLTTAEQKLVEVRKLLADYKTSLPSTAPPDVKARVESQIKTLQDLTNQSTASKSQFDEIKKTLDLTLNRLPKF